MWEAAKHPLERVLRRVEQERNRARSRLQRTYRAARAACWEYNLLTSEIEWSDEFYELYSIDRSIEPNPEAIFSAIHPDDLDRVMESFWETLTPTFPSDTWEIEYRLHPDRGQRWIRATADIERARDGHTLRVHGVSIDITGLKALEAERAARAQAEAALQARDEFLGVVTHDIRSPLTAITLGTEVLERMAPSTEEGRPLRELANRVHRASESMQTLVDDLLDVAQIGAGKLRLRLVPHDPGALVENAVEVFTQVAKQSSIALHSEIGDSRPIRCDPNRISQVLSNLISNALKFTEPEGTILVATRAPSEPAANEVCFAVSDTGGGIPPELRERIFERFFQGAARGRSGAGLGLFIARGIVEAHGGRIWVESEVGKGTTLFFTVPTA
jgi:signal transduction histidine kinase